VAPSSHVPARAFLLLGGIAVALLGVVGEPVRGWLFVGILATTAAGSVYAARLAVAERFGWHDPTVPVAAGLLLLLPAYVLWYPGALAWDLHLGSPAITDALFLPAYGCFLWAMVRLVRLRGGDDRRVQTLDTLVVSTGLGALTWISVIGPALHAEGLGAWAKVVAVSYPILDLLLLGGLVRLLVQRTARTVAEWSLIGWIVTQLAADLLYTSTWLHETFSFEPTTTLYAGSFVLLGAALLHPELERIVDPVPPTPVGLGRVPVLGAATLMAPAALVGLGLRDGSTDVAVVALLAAVLFGLVLLRVAALVVDVREHERVQAELTEMVQQVRERSMLAERLSRIQREISSRAPLHEVLDAITAGAADLLGDEVVGLRLVDPAEPATMVMVSSIGVPDPVREEIARLPVGTGVGGQAIVDDELCSTERYGGYAGAIPELRAGGLETAMAAPVRIGGQAIGSLVVASHQPGRHYSDAERDILLAFAEHASLALNDANSVQALQEALAGATHQARHDSLTGLPNRACFYERAEAALAAGPTAVVLLDLDRFKDVNDALGHRYGDRLLCHVGERIAHELRDDDTLARLGGDEFCVLLPGVDDPAVAAAVAERVTASLHEPFEVDGMALAVGASAGVAVAPTHGDTVDLLLQRADVAMYTAKSNRADVVMWNVSLDPGPPAQLGLLAELRAAIAGGQLVLHHQPIVSRDGGATAFEALVRWQHPDLGLLGPDRFVPLAEDTGLIRPLTTWVLRAALADLGRWRDAGAVGSHVAVSVNLSAQSLLDERVVDEVVGALADSGVPARCLVLEITETAIMDDPAAAKEVVTELTSLGVRVAIDDFGTGYSSLAYLKRLPVDQLKIDRSFVQQMGSDQSDVIIVRSVVDLARNLGLRTVAEGVEDQATFEALLALGCDAAQGFHLGRPMPAEAVPGWLAAQETSVSSRSSSVSRLTTSWASPPLQNTTGGRVTLL
jgi:diguanylate cyclase (GGDEF)-like protein